MGKHRPGHKTGGRRPGSGRPPKSDPASYAAYLVRRNADLRRWLTECRRELAAVRCQLADAITRREVPLVPAPERDRRLTRWFERRAARVRLREARETAP